MDFIIEPCPDTIILLSMLGALRGNFFIRNVVFKNVVFEMNSKKMKKGRLYKTYNYNETRSTEIEAVITRRWKKNLINEISIVQLPENY